MRSPETRPIQTRGHPWLLLAVPMALALMLAMLVTGMRPAMAGHNGADVTIDIDSDTGVATLTAEIAQPGGDHQVGNMRLVVHDGTDTHVSPFIPTDDHAFNWPGAGEGGETVSVSVGPFPTDTTVLWRVFGGAERDYDEPLWNGHGEAGFSADITAYGAAHGFGFTTAGPDDPNPFTNWHELFVPMHLDDPETRQDCMQGGWEAFGFDNQGMCIQFVNTGKDSREIAPLVVRLGAVLWLDASAMPLEDSDAVASWEDLSGNENHAGTLPGAGSPSYSSDAIASRAAVSFGGSDGLRVADDPTLDFGEETDFTVFAVIQFDDWPSDQATILGKGDRGGNPRMLYKVDDGGRPHFTVARGSGPHVLVGSTDLSGAGGHVVTFQAIRESSMAIFVDGAVEAQNASDTTDTDISTQVGLSIGVSHQEGSELRRFWHGDIAEVIIYDRALSSGERAAVEAYLMDKYGGS